MLDLSNIDSNDGLTGSSHNEDTLAFCSNLLNAIRSFINDYADEYEDVISIEIVNEGNDCFVFMSTNMYYYTHLLFGYQIIDDKMVAYYFNYNNDTLSFYNFVSQINTKDKKEFLSESECSNCLIDKSKLKTDYPIVFPNEYSDFATGWIYEPRGRKYIIHSPDSLELVFEGYY